MVEAFRISGKEHGTGPLRFEWSSNGRFLAVAGQTKKVRIYDRTGGLVDEVALTSKACLDLAWDKEGDALAILQEATNIVLLWSRKEKKTSQLDAADEASLIIWSKASEQLAIGTTKGNLILYDHKTGSKTPHNGKHSRKITCGVWNSDTRIALAAEDKTLTLSDAASGSLIDSFTLNGEPHHLQFGRFNTDEKQSIGEYPSVEMNKKTILLYQKGTEKPIELEFTDQYGEIINYFWVDEGQLAIGFKAGIIIVLNIRAPPLDRPVRSYPIEGVRPGELKDIKFNKSFFRFATCFEDGLHVLSVSELKDVFDKKIVPDEGKFEKVQWSPDGQLLTASTTTGAIHAYYAAAPQQSASHGSRLTYLSSTRKLSLLNAADDNYSTTVDLPVDPVLVGLGPTQIGVAADSKVYYYSLDPTEGAKTEDDSESKDPHPPLLNLVHERDYGKIVRRILLNETHAAVLVEGKVILHALKGNKDKSVTDRTFPSDEKEGYVIGAVVLTEEYLIYTSGSSIYHYLIKNNAIVNEFKHDFPIVACFPNHNGLRVAFIDSNRQGFIANPVDNSRLAIPNFPSITEKILWDTTVDRQVLVAMDGRKTCILWTYVYIPQTIHGPSVERISKTEFSDFTAVLLYDGMIYGQRSTGALSFVPLQSHEFIHHKAQHTFGASKRKQATQQLIALSRLSEAWELNLLLQDRELWVSLAQKALDRLDVDLAVRCYRQIKDTSMVLALEEIQGLEDRHLISGHIHLLSGNHKESQKEFMKSSRPHSALDMRRDLRHWDKALKLAASLAPKEIPSISREYAQELEIKEDYIKANQMYKNALESKFITTEDKKICEGGIARMTIRMGDIKAGMDLAQKSGNKQLIKECAGILETSNKAAEAADAYVAAEEYEKAARIYINTKNFAKASPLMNRCTTLKLHAEYAKAREDEGNFKEAEVGYEKAQDVNSVIRLNLTVLNQPEKAFNIVRSSQTAEGALLAAKYCQEKGNLPVAIEFLVLAGKIKEAFDLAQTHKLLPKFAEALGAGGSQQDHAKIAKYYEESKDYQTAAKYYAVAQEYVKAVELYIKSSNVDLAIDLIKSVAASSRSPLLKDTTSAEVVTLLYDHLTGKSDGQPKELKHVYALYGAIGEPQEAARVALIAATEYQQRGRYQAARDVLRDVYGLLVNKAAVPHEIRRTLLLNHSYLLATKLLKKHDYELAARLLLRVAKNVRKFPKHGIQIITACVMACQRAGLRKSAVEYASILLKPINKDKVKEKHRKSFEQLAARNRTGLFDLQENVSACPFCGLEIGETLLDCPGCYNEIPYCVTTGKHTVIKELTFCPHCNFPSIYSALVAQVKDKEPCAMCNQPLDLSSITLAKEERIKKFLESGSVSSGLPPLHTSSSNPSLSA